MKNTIRAFFWFAMICLLTRVFAQQVNESSPSELRYDTGTISNGIYTNPCMGFSLAIPAGWESNKLPGDSETVRIGTHLQQGVIDLFTMNRHSDPPSMNGLVLRAYDAAPFSGTIEEFVRRATHGLVDRDPTRYEIVGEPFPVVYGAKQFYRSDYKQNLPNGGAWYFASLFTKFRGYLLGAVITTSSQAALNDAREALRGISFSSDQIDARCVVGDNKLTGRIVGVIGSVSSGTGVSQASGGNAQRVRVSSGVANAFLVKKVDPIWPDAAVQPGARSPVVLRIVVTKEGNVSADIEVISGDPKLVPAVVDAVKQWKFKPYLLNGQPVEIQTVLSLAFEAPSH